MGRMQGKVAIVTGAAGGIGAATAARLSEEGAAVLLVDREETALQRVCSDIASDRVEYAVADVTDSAAVDAYTRRAVETFGGLDAVVLNAGLAGDIVPVDQYSEEMFDKVLAVNIKGVWYGLRAAIGPMRERGGGSIVITSSTQGMSGYYYCSPYTTSKHAVVGMARGAAMDLATDRIRVNTVHPGTTDTSMMDGLHDAANPTDPQSVMDAWSAIVPMRRYAQPRETANVMLFLASDESSYCTGSSFVVDGGITAFHGGPAPE
jgi:NAD(P)-dependent dehydrogenase (short-subunit alcohol dehydrogenase family)